MIISAAMTIAGGVAIKQAMTSVARQIMDSVQFVQFGSSTVHAFTLRRCWRARTTPLHARAACTRRIHGATRIRTFTLLPHCAHIHTLPLPTFYTPHRPPAHHHTLPRALLHCAAPPHPRHAPLHALRTTTCARTHFCTAAHSRTACCRAYAHAAFAQQPTPPTRHLYRSQRGMPLASSGS